MKKQLTNTVSKQKQLTISVSEKQLSDNVSKKVIPDNVSGTKQLVDTVSGEIIILPNWRTQYNTSPLPGKRITEPSLTVPDQALTVSEIMKRWASGRPITNTKNPLYNGDLILPDQQKLRRMDLADREALVDELTDRYNKLQDKLQELKKEDPNDELNILKTQLRVAQEQLSKAETSAQQSNNANQGTKTE